MEPTTDLAITAWMSFGAGFLSFFSPCILPLIPVYFSFLAGTSATTSPTEKKLLLWEVLLFVLGFSTIFILLGASATTIGSFLFSNARLFLLLSQNLILILALHFLGVLKIPALERNLRTQAMPRIPVIGSYLFGAAFAFSWTPCVGPILGSILSFAATQETVGKGILLLSLYSAGLALPFFLTGLFFSQFRVVQRFIARRYLAIQIATGAILLGFAVYLMKGLINV